MAQALCPGALAQGTVLLVNIEANVFFKINVTGYYRTPVDYGPTVRDRSTLGLRVGAFPGLLLLEIFFIRQFY